MYTVYSNPGSGGCAVEAVLAWLRLPYTVVDLNIYQQAQLSPEHRRRNPTAKIPCLEDGAGQVITESAAILLTLNERHPEGQLLPESGSSERAFALRWLLFMAGEIYPLIEIIDYPERFVPGEEQGKALRQRMIERICERWLVVEAAIAGDPWFLASGPSLLDPYVSILSRWTLKAEWRDANIPNIEGIFRAFSTHPLWSPVWLRHAPPA